MLDIAHAGTPIFLTHGHAEQAHIAHLAPEVGGELVGTVDLRRPGCDLGRRKIGHAVAQHIGGFTKVEIERARGVGEHGRVSSTERLSRDILVLGP